ncbi:PEP-CTERM sorting domain-containing protein [Luteolibacter flavescens]|uniref:PEP-CTERM sorting domain-containing protein n=1 Tax=Luteolibacter flavescens TaxID=1859460 RepID=A0ABT3FPT3_9BACT|nr:PEP-CTERM sorting domain-containing protein [Luteolibacter flavescens]MCW1885582.1 PEP-CTERM sorting domain-containing protein [Luteolibacter flavescens]
MKATLRSRLIPATAAIGVLLSLATAEAAVVSYYVGVDTMQTIASGEFAGMANPNYNRLTFLYAHPNESAPASSHYHSKGIYRYQPTTGVSPVIEQSPSNYLPEGSNPPLTFTSGSGLYSGVTIALEDPGNHFSLIDFGDTSSLSGHAAGTVENYLFNSSAGRYAGSLGGADIHLVLVSMTEGLNIGSDSAFSIGLTNPGDELHLGGSVNFSPVFWLDANAGAGDYVARFKLVDEEGIFGDSGEFEFRFNAVPEPSSALLAGAAVLCGLVRRRR